VSDTLTLVEPEIDEARLRRQASKHGYRLAKSRSRNRDAVDYGQYLIVNVETNAAVFPGWMTVGQVEAFFA
jgi:hypothetical protein